MNNLSSKKARYAINICDLSSLQADNPLPIQILMADFLSKESPIAKTNKHYVDSGAVVLNGPVERIKALITLLQTVIGPRKIGRRVRCYVEGSRGGWTELR